MKENVLCLNEVLMKKHVLGLIIGIIAFASAVLLTPIVAYQFGRLETHLDLR